MHPRSMGSGIFVTLLRGEFYSVQAEEAPVRNKRLFFFAHKLHKSVLNIFSSHFSVYALFMIFLKDLTADVILMM